jgi:TolB-like protein/Tfp pilus assembly protein PilF
MFTDIVGYDSLLKEDEKKAFEIRKKNQRIHKRLIKKFNGRWLKDIESGTLASFTSNIDAVMCAVYIQKAAEDINVQLSIGVHQGDVIFENKDVLGDGVNIASRIQSFADTHGIVISEKVYSDIANKEGLETEFLGDHDLKGISKPVGVYKVNCTDESLLDFTIDTGELIRPLSFGRKTIVIGILVIAILAYALYYLLPKFSQTSAELGTSVLVLPFDNYLGTDTLDYIVAGMHNELINDIQKVSALNVKCKTTANAVKNSNMSIPEIADELGVNTFIEGAVLCIGDSICYQAKMFDREEKVLWTRDYKVERSQILSLYNKVTKDIADRINVVLTPEEEQLLARSRTVDREVYDLYLKGFSYMEDMSIEAVYKAMDNLNSAIEKDPDWAPLYAGLAKVWIVIATFSYESPSVAYQNMYDNLEKALELDSNLTDGQYIRAMSSYLYEWNWDKSVKEFLKVLAINPNDVLARMYYSHLLSILQRPDEALTQGQLALDLDPLNPLIQALFAALNNCIGDCETAKTYYEKVLEVDPDHFLANENMIFTAYECKEYERGWEALKLNLIQKQIVNIDQINKIEEIINNQGYIAAHEEMVNHLERMAESGYVDPINLISPADMAYYHYIINQDDMAIKWLESGFEMHHPIMPYVFTRIWDFSRLQENPRFIDIARKMKLPLP